MNVNFRRTGKSNSFIKLLPVIITPCLIFFPASTQIVADAISSSDLLAMLLLMHSLKWLQIVQVSSTTNQFNKTARLPRNPYVCVQIIRSASLVLDAPRFLVVVVKFRSYFHAYHFSLTNTSFFFRRIDILYFSKSI